MDFGIGVRKLDYYLFFDRNEFFRVSSLILGRERYGFGPDRSIRWVWHALKVGQNELDCSSRVWVG